MMVTPQLTHPHVSQRGIVLVSSLLLLLVMTIMALSMFRSFGLQQKIAGNVREKQRALQAAESAQAYAEWWLTQGNAVDGAAQVCTDLLNANIGQGQICSNPLPTIVGNNAIPDVPWIYNGVNVGVSYIPPTMPASLITQTSGQGTYYGNPTFYISDLGASADAANYPGEIYQVDAYGYGASADTAAVVESTYAVYTASSNRTM